MLSFLNFIAIQYTLIIEEIPFLKAIFPRLYIFFLLFILLYIPLAIIVGWYDFRRGAVPTSFKLSAKASPFYRDLAKTLILLSDNPEVRELMEKWVDEL